MRRFLNHPFLLTTLYFSHTANAFGQVKDASRNITYQGFSRNGIDSLLNIPFGQDTGGQNRFTPPEAFIPTPGTVFNNTVPGPVCPQVVDGSFPYNSDASNQSEDCLNLLVARPSNVTCESKLPVMVYIYGGCQYCYFPTSLDHMLYYVVYVSMNYRLNIFGFALSEALGQNNSLNVGFRDQRLALEWVRDNIAWFGGDPDRVTLFGQSSGGLSVGTQMLAYGGSKKALFHRAICESTALEPRTTSNATQDSFNGVVEKLRCARNGTQSIETLQCLRSLPTNGLFNATYEVWQAMGGGDQYLPSVDGDFLPAAPSQLLREGRFTAVPLMAGWTMNDNTLFIPRTIRTEADTLALISATYPDLTNTTLSTILSLYPSTSFTANPSANLTAEFYRSAQITRDILFVCPSFLLGSAISSVSNMPVYYYEQNQTILTPFLNAASYIGLQLTGLGIVHTSELPYVYGDLSVYNTSIYAFHPSASDYALAKRQSRSWSTFAYTRDPVGMGDTFKGWESAYGDGKMETKVFVVGGDEEGSSALEGSRANSGVVEQRLKERCGFLNSEGVVAQLKY